MPNLSSIYTTASMERMFSYWDQHPGLQLGVQHILRFVEQVYTTSVGGCLGSAESSEFAVMCTTLAKELVPAEFRREYPTNTRHVGSTGLVFHLETRALIGALGHLWLYTHRPDAPALDHELVRKFCAQVQSVADNFCRLNEMFKALSSLNTVFGSPVAEEHLTPPSDRWLKSANLTFYAAAVNALPSEE